MSIIPSSFTLPAVYISLYTRKVNKYAAGLGWFAGMTTAITMLYQLGFGTSLYKNLDFIYVGIFALVVNLIVMGVIMLIFMAMGKVKDEGIIDNNEFT